MPPSSRRDVVLVAGASGFVGRALGRALSERYEPVGLSRRERPASDGYARFVQCDLLSLEDTARALEGARYAVYLVHSMLPTSRLTQASFEDLDLLCADNFARAAARAGVERIVYLGGLIPEGGTALSEHLESRLEVERVLGGRGVPTTVIRAGIVLGAEGSSYQIVSRLVRRLPFMICPAWTRTKTQPVALADVVSLVTFALRDERTRGRVFDVGVPEVVTYLEIMQRYAAAIGLHRAFVPVWLFSPGLSRLWLSLVTGAPRALAAPLVESLRHEMTARDAELAALAGMTPTSFDDALAKAVAEERALTVDPFGSSTTGTNGGPSTVVSIQRASLARGRDAAWAAREYPAWLSRALGWLLRVRVDDEGTMRFRLRLGGLELLVLSPVPESSSSDRALYRVVGGALAKPHQSGTLEFRTAKDDGTLLTIVRDFEPSLPWWIYRGTQSIVHELIMRAFGRALRHAPPGPEERSERRDALDARSPDD
ncbi:MAG: NAD(P)H-binding protein [Polyangiales bacterium]